MKHYITIGLLIGSAILGNVATASAQRWGRGATPRSGACFYENNNFGGRYFCTGAGATTADVPPALNDTISSVRLFGNATVTVFRDASFRGQSKVITSDVADLRGMGFNDRISSYRVDTAQVYDRGAISRNGTYPGSGAQVYDRGAIARDGNYPGRVQANGSRLSYRDAQAVVRRSYQSVLGREPDPEGLRSWTQQVMDNGLTERELENQLRNTDEFRASHRYNRRR